MECGLFLYMAPFILSVCFWFATAPGVNIWFKAAKVIMQLPSAIFQFTWAAACVKYWHMLDEDGTSLRSFLNGSESEQGKNLVSSS